MKFSRRAGKALTCNPLPLTGQQPRRVEGSEGSAIKTIEYTLDGVDRQRNLRGILEAGREGTGEFLGN